MEDSETMYDGIIDKEKKETIRTIFNEKNYPANHKISIFYLNFDQLL